MNEKTPGDLLTSVAADFAPAVSVAALGRALLPRPPTGRTGRPDRNWAATAGKTPVGVRNAPVEKLLRRLDVGLATDSQGMEQMARRAYERGSIVKWEHLTPGQRAEFTRRFTRMVEKRSPQYNWYASSIAAPMRRGVDRRVAEGILGHEVGHAVLDKLRKPGRQKWMRRLYAGGPLATGVLTGAASLGHDNTIGQDAALAAGGVLASLPQVVEETRASAIGARLLRLKGLAKLRAFRGVPTYILGALAPAMAIGARRGIDKLRDR